MYSGSRGPAEFAARRRRKSGIIFFGGVYVEENTAQPASVQIARQGRAMRARSGLQALWRKKPKDFSASLRIAPKGDAKTAVQLMSPGSKACQGRQSAISTRPWSCSPV